ncbi:bifunctional apoptosis regulator [Biomphalaria pfeifferi]|uniref:Bifunctional apoptosis regulator n=1 Tax=Biomphalaria pfeifferi TaxID=112525 RepID=A0AAD8BEL5_BIOPF|nr:bifunctional apoptosis regulator [Biomphalaria pfeifferi]
MDIAGSSSSTNQGWEITHRKSEASNDLEAEFSCSVCFQLAVQPTTLTCGHTSCRLCLAKWYFNSNKKECPMCRQMYEGHPKVNTQIRNMIQKLLPGKIEERENELEAEAEDLRILKKFDKALSRASNGGPGQTDLNSFCSGIFIAFGIFVVIYLAWFWQSSDSNLLVLKPVQTWKAKDVATWLQEMGWANGNLLISLNGDSLRRLLNVSDPTHERAFLFAIDMLKDHGVKMPITLWDYKALYPGRSLFLVYGMKDFPRTCLLYLWMYFYDEMFISFVKTTTHSSEDLLLTSNLQTTDISGWQWFNFLTLAVLLPESLVVLFAWQMFSQHYFSPMFVVATAVLYQLMEIQTWISFYNHFEMRSLYVFFKSWLRQLISAFIFMILWPLVPSLLCDIFFYSALYVSPVQAFFAVLNKFRQQD